MAVAARTPPLLLATAIVCAGCQRDYSPPQDAGFDSGVADSSSPQDARFDAGVEPGDQCNNGILDGNESDVDCGGGDCKRCGDVRMCRGAADCVSRDCSA